MSILIVKNLEKKFGELSAVSGVSFQVQPGEIYGLLGPNGAGKTTSMSMICGLLRPDDGHVTVDGEDFWQDPQAAQRKMGVVPQEVALYENLSGKENLLFWGRLSGVAKQELKGRVAEILEALALSDRATDRVKTYSGGMKRRINIGCALMHRPKLLLLDEPTVGIDPQARQNILEFIEGLKSEGTSILYTTHYLEEAERLCQRIGIIDKGKILAEGTLDELQGKIGSDRLFVLEGDFGERDPKDENDLLTDFNLIQHSSSNWVVASKEEIHPAEGLRQLLNLSIPVENVTVKKPNLNDVFLQLTGRALRE